jgi:NAD(P)-dependent dehydrogenase (short-subunit alcohol dehydrogenase family)
LFFFFSHYEYPAAPIYHSSSDFPFNEQAMRDHILECFTYSTTSKHMKRVLIFGNSGGIGAAIQEACIAKGYNVLGLSRSQHDLDLSDESKIISAIETLDGSFDQIFITTGALVVNSAEPEKTIRQFNSDAALDQFITNAVGPTLILKHIKKLIDKNSSCFIGVLSARVGSIGDNKLGGWYSYRASKAALNQFIRTTAIEYSRSFPNLTCVAIHPGTVRTNFTKKYLGRHPAVSPQDASTNILQLAENLKPECSGQFFDWDKKTVPW